MSLVLLVVGNTFSYSDEKSQVVAPLTTIPADYHLLIKQGQHAEKFTIEAKTASEAKILVEGLSLGGAVEVLVNSQPQNHLELLSTGGSWGGLTRCR